MRILILSLILLLSCSTTKKSSTNGISEQEMLEKNLTHEKTRMQYKLISSSFNDKKDVWASAQKQLGDFDEAKYTELKPFIYERSINEIQQFISERKLNYELLTKWYLYRIVKFESDPKTSLHAIIAINPDAVDLARQCDYEKNGNSSRIYGMPILLKDNIGTAGMATTAGAIVLSNNFTRDAKIVENLKANGAIILGKANLSEWAYFFCQGCPVGYSAVGGQTLNPYGRGEFESGGSSSASGAAVAANYAVAAIGTETSGSILSPSAQNSVVGLKPTIGVASRSGIVPISSTLDTPGPMTKNVSDNAILLAAIAGKDKDDSSTTDAPEAKNYTVDNLRTSISLFKFAVNTTYLESSPLYKSMIEELRTSGATIIEFTPERADLNGFRDILYYDMKKDLPKYLSSYSPRSVQVRSVKDVIDFNKESMDYRAPYGQGNFEASSAFSMAPDSMEMLKERLEENARAMYAEMFEVQKVDAILSINNYDAGYAAIAKYPALALPMGYTEEGEPRALTLIGLPFHEQELLNMAKTIKDGFPKRVPPASMID